MKKYLLGMKKKPIFANFPISYPMKISAFSLMTPPSIRVNHLHHEKTWPLTRSSRLWRSGGGCGGAAGGSGGRDAGEDWAREKRAMMDAMRKLQTANSELKQELTRARIWSASPWYLSESA